MLGRQRLTAVTSPGASFTGCSSCSRRHPQPLCALSTEESARLAGYSKGVPSWNELQASVPEKDLLNGYRVRPGQKPGTVGSSVLPTAESTVSKKSVLLYKDTSGWCPHCEKVLIALEEKQISYDSVLIDLYNKPAWYKRKVPTQLVPAAAIRDSSGSIALRWESLDILKKLEEVFPDRPLLPQDEAKRKEALELIASAADVDGIGYKFMAGGRLMTRDRGRGETDQQSMAEAQDAFEAKMAEVEQLLGRHPEGPFFMGEVGKALNAGRAGIALRDFGMADIVFAPALERLAANLPVLRHVDLRDAERRPNLAAWFKAMDARPSYAKAKSDDYTHNLIARKLFSIAGAAEKRDDEHQPAREEAALKIRSNRRAIVKDILQNSGLLRGRCNLYGGTMGSVNGYSTEPSLPQVEAVEFALRRVCLFLLSGRVGGKHEHLEANALGSAALAFFHNRASAPRDLSAAAAEQLRAACLKVITAMY